MGEVQDGYSNIVLNALNQVDARDTAALGGQAEVILFEALSSYLLRWTFGTEKESFFKLVLIHAMASPMHGGFANLIQMDVGNWDADYSKQLSRSMYGIPAVFLSQYIVNTPDKGLRVPGISMKDALITASSKLITKPIIKFLYKNGPKGNQYYLNAQTVTETKQKNANAQFWEKSG